MLNPLLDDLQDERTEFLIREGNLRRAKAAPEFIPQWTHQGYLAKVGRNLCDCGELSDFLIGVFSREKAATGQIRDTALARGFQIPLGKSFPVEVTEGYVKICCSCLPVKGFRSF